MLNGKNFEGSEKQVKWAKDAFQRHGKNVIIGLNDLKNNNKSPFMGIVMNSIKVKMVATKTSLQGKDKAFLDKSIDKAIAKIEAMTTQDWIDFDQVQRYADDTLTGADRLILNTFDLV